MPVVLEEQVGRNIDLLGQGGYPCPWYLVPLVGKATLVLEKLEQDGKAETIVILLGGKQDEFGGEESPVLDQVIGVPVALHEGADPLCRVRREEENKQSSAFDRLRNFAGKRQYKLACHLRQLKRKNLRSTVAIL